MAGCTPIVQSEDYDVRLSITQTNETNRLAGVHNPDLNADDLGWELDITRMATPPSEGHLTTFPVDANDTRTERKFEDQKRNHLYLKLLETLSRDGIPYEYWQQGVSGEEACEFKSLRATELDRLFPMYAPIVNNGGYHIGPGDYFLYSDVSHAQRLSYYGLSDSATHLAATFAHQPDLSYPVRCRMYKRNDCGAPLVHIDLDQSDTFLGEVDTSGDEPVRTSYYIEGDTPFDDMVAALDIDNIQWDSVDRLMRLFIIDISQETPDETTLTYTFRTPFRNPIVPTIPGDRDNNTIPFFDRTTAKEDDSYVGITSGRACQVLYTKYFPIDTLTRLLLFDEAGYPTCGDVYSSNAQEWMEVTTFDFSLPGDRHFMVDYDLGRIIFGGKQADSTLLCTAATAIVTSLITLDASDFW